MKKMILVLVLLSSYCFALTPFSLEGFKQANVRVLYKGDLLKKSFLEKLQADVLSNIKNMGIKTSSKEFSNLLIKINIEEAGEEYAVLTSLFIVESVNPIRDKELQNIAITYKKDDFFIRIFSGNFECI